MLINLNHLQTSSRTLNNCHVRRENQFWKAKRAIASLVKSLNKRDIEDRGIIATESEVNKGISPGVTGLEDQGTAVDGPFGSVSIGDGLIYSATWKRELWSERV